LVNDGTTESAGFGWLARRTKTSFTVPLFAKQTTSCPPPTYYATTNCAQQTPIFAAHDSDDDVVGFELGLAAAERLQSADYALTWQMAHSVCEEKIAEIGAWLTKRFSAR